MNHGGNDNLQTQPAEMLNSSATCIKIQLLMWPKKGLCNNVCFLPHCSGSFTHSLFDNSQCSVNYSFFSLQIKCVIYPCDLPELHFLGVKGQSISL